MSEAPPSDTQERQGSTAEETSRSRPQQPSWGSPRRTYLVLLALSVLLAALTLAPFWKPLFLGAVLAGVTHPGYGWLDERLHGHHYVVAALMAIAVAILVLLPFSFLGAVVISEGTRAIEFIRESLARGGIEGLAARLPAQLQAALGSMTDALKLDEETLRKGASAGGVGVARVGAGLIASAAGALFSLGLMMIAYVSFLVDGPRFLRWLTGISPMEESRTSELLEGFRGTSAAVLGSALVGVATHGVVATIGYAIAGVPSPIFFAVLTAFASLIPIVGTQLVYLPLAAALLLAGDTWQGIFLFVWGLVVATVVDNAVRPLVVKTGMGMSGAVVFFALLGGMAAFGFVGALLGPLAITFFMAMIRTPIGPVPERGRAKTA